MNNDKIIQALQHMGSFNSEYLLFRAGTSNAYFGRNAEGYLVFVLGSQNERLPRFMQQTNSLSFCFNERGIFEIDGVQETKVVHLLICKETDQTKEDAFIRLTNAFSINETPDDPYYVAKLFAALSSLFDKRHVATDIELQGLYGELFTMLYFQENGCDISCYWQSRDRMNYDYTISNQKRLEIKSTTKPERVYHFKHSQLLSSSYDIRVVSIMLQKSDVGLSLMDIITDIRHLYQDNYKLMLHIDSLVSGMEEEEIKNIVFDEAYLRQNIRIYDARLIPHFNEMTPEGVFNAEYNSSLENIADISLEDIIQWIEKE